MRDAISIENLSIPLLLAINPSRSYPLTVCQYVFSLPVHYISLKSPFVDRPVQHTLYAFSMSEPIHPIAIICGPINICHLTFAMAHSLLIFLTFICATSFKQLQKESLTDLRC